MHLTNNSPADYAATSCAVLIRLQRLWLMTFLGSCIRSAAVVIARALSEERISMGEYAYARR